MSGQPKNKGFTPNLQAPTPGFSYWETKGWLRELDAVVVGGGLVGMSAALHLRERYPNWNIVVVDRKTLGSATTRNAGFACFGSPSELLEDLNQLGTDEMARLVSMRWEGLNALRDAWGDEAIGYRPCGALEAFADGQLLDQCREALPALNEALSDVFGQAPFQEQKSGQDAGLTGLKGTIASPLEGDLDAAKLATTMRRQLQRSQIAFLAGHEVLNLSRHHGQWTLETLDGEICAHHVLVTTNGWASKLLDLDVKTAPNTVIVSQPLEGLKLTQTIHHDRGYVYAREIDGRVLIGGGRHWSCSEKERIQRLQNWAAAHVVGASSFEVAHHWQGHLGVGATRGPIVQSLGHGLHAGVRMGGMGVAIGTQVGRKLAGLV